MTKVNHIYLKYLKLYLFLITIITQNLISQDKLPQDSFIKVDFVINKTIKHDPLKNILLLCDSLYVSEWEKIILNNKYNLIDRSQIKFILDENKLKQSGISSEEYLNNACKITGVDAILIIKIRLYDNYYKDYCANLISVKTGENLFVSTFWSMLVDNSKESTIKVHSKLENWKNDLFIKYQTEKVKYNLDN